MNDYKKQVLEDIREWANEGNADGLNIDGVRDRLQDPAWSDSITGNASGSYYCNTYKAQEQIQNSGLLFDEAFISYLEDMGMNIGELLSKGAEVVDVWARCAVIDLLSDEELEEAIKQ